MIPKGLFRLLPAPHREVLILTKFIGLGIEETAHKLGISKSAVKVRVHRAIRRLEKLMEAEDP